MIILASQALKNIPFSDIYVKLKAISSVANNTIKKVAEIFQITYDILKSWIKKFAKNGVEGLKNKAKQPKKSRLSNEQKIKIKDWIEKNPNITLVEAYEKTYKAFKIKVSKSTMYNYFKKFEFSHITPRPRHVKQKPENIEKFKLEIKKKDRKKP